MAADESACPVDHKTRDAWLAQAQAAASVAPKPSCPVDHDAAQQSPPQPSKSWTQTLSSYIWSSPSSTSSTTTTTSSTPSTSPILSNSLNTSRVISSIPRATLSDSYPTTSPTPGCPLPHGASANPPANHEVESGHDAPSGNWIYPSEKMFFDAMKRKGYDAREADMRTVVPIHNAVNERAWKQIQQWEAPYLASSKCNGPKLESFANKNDYMTPTARINTLLGYAAPFDRHDWVIDRCGTRVEYVIDFYPGRPGTGAGSVGVPSFYLDVRPKLNTWEGVRMRVMRWTGLA